jgi:hypothetical protein
VDDEKSNLNITLNSTETGQVRKAREGLSFFYMNNKSYHMDNLMHLLIIGLLVGSLLVLFLGGVKCGSKNTALRTRSIRAKALPSDDLHPLVGATCWQYAGTMFSLTITADDSGNLTGAQFCRMNQDGSCDPSAALNIAGNMLVGGPFSQMGYLASQNILQTSAGVYLTRMDCGALRAP